MLKYYYGVMGSGKSAKIIEYCKTHENVICLKLKFEREFYDVIHSRNGQNVPCINFNRETNFIKMFYLNNDVFNAKTIIIDEVQFCTPSQIEQLSLISNRIDVICFGLLRNNDGRLFDSTHTLVQLCDEMYELTRKCVCCKTRQATISRRYHRADTNKNYKLDNDTYQVPQIATHLTQYLSLCNKCAREHDSFTKLEIDTMLKEVL